MKVEALRQQPGVVGQDAVLEEDHDQLAAHLDKERQVSPRMGECGLSSGGRLTGSDEVW